ncbi:MAG: hypothetical protein EAX96_09805 [Candidatus Lokiarchaeota archaeon]|nr:hypothetical protein [Candidatus Lokiarchaeota archaeon]
MNVDLNKIELQDIFTSLYDKIEDLTLNFEYFNKIVSFFIEDRTKKFSNRMKDKFVQNENQSKDIFQFEIYTSIKEKLEKKYYKDEFFEKNLVKLYKELKKLLDFLKNFENSFINLIINNFSSNDMLHLKVNLLMREFNDRFL